MKKIFICWISFFSFMNFNSQTKELEKKEILFFEVRGGYLDYNIVSTENHGEIDFTTSFAKEMVLGYFWRKNYTLSISYTIRNFVDWSELDDNKFSSYSSFENKTIILRAEKSYHVSKRNSFAIGFGIGGAQNKMNSIIVLTPQKQVFKTVEPSTTNSLSLLFFLNSQTRIWWRFELILETRFAILGKSESAKKAVDETGQEIEQEALKINYISAVEGIVGLRYTL